MFAADLYTVMVQRQDAASAIYADPHLLFLA